MLIATVGRQGAALSMLLGELLPPACSLATALAKPQWLLFIWLPTVSRLVAQTCIVSRSGNTFTLVLHTPGHVLPLMLCAAAACCLACRRAILCAAATSSNHMLRVSQVPAGGEAAAE